MDGNETDKCSDDREGQQWSNHSFFETMNTDQLINSSAGATMTPPLSRGLRSIQVSHLLTQLHRVESSTFVRFERPREALFHKFGLKPRVIPGGQPSSGYWRQCQGVGKGGDALRNGRRQWHSEVYKAVIDLNSNTMDLEKIQTTTTLRALPSGHVAHKLTEFAPGGWKA